MHLSGLSFQPAGESDITVVTTSYLSKHIIYKSALHCLVLRPNYEASDGQTPYSRPLCE